MKWTDELIEQELLKSMDILQLDRMPTATELKGIGRNDLHCKVSRTKKYSGWAEHLGLTMTKCDSRTGHEGERIVSDTLISLGMEVEQMSYKHPYDLLIDGSVKIDVKIAKQYKHESGQNWWVFHLSKTEQTCDIYICLALDDEKPSRLFVIPSHHVRMKSINIGQSSKYDRYIDKFDYIRDYVDFFNSIK